MGLAAPKNRSKISNDPQNTTWANNTTRFGHRILASQGWQPGSSLGASDAAHAAHYTVASQSHIRVFLKDDNLGLGAKRGSERAENFGLAGLESILGRLNGNEAAVKKEEERRDKIEQRAYVYKKYGFMNFVSGGFLVGDEIKTRQDIKKEPQVKAEVKSEPESEDGKVANKTNKRKRQDRDEAPADELIEDQPQVKRKKKSMNLREEARRQSTEDSTLKKSRKEKKNKAKKEKISKKEKKSASSDPEPMIDDVPSAASEVEPLTDKARRKAEKKARKEEKKVKKALKRAAKEAAKSNGDAEDSSSESEDKSDPTTCTQASAPATGASTPTVSAAGSAFGARGMHAVRQRWIRQKKAASMDPRALKEIFMIKTPS